MCDRRGMQDHFTQIAADGYSLVPAVFAANECSRLAEALERCLQECRDEAASLRRGNGVIYGARNLLDLFPAAAELWRRPILLELLQEVLGPECGLVRGLFFDKPPAGNWSLPWHQDTTIAVTDHSLPNTRFRNRTLKAGVPHVEAPDELLRMMLTLRIHLDQVTTENGPLQVIPRTHHGRCVVPEVHQPVTIQAAAGDVLAMRPLLAHASMPALEGTCRQRRVIHLEFAAAADLREGYSWHWFVKLDR